MSRTIISRSNGSNRTHVHTHTLTEAGHSRTLRSCLAWQFCVSAPSRAQVTRLPQNVVYHVPLSAIRNYSRMHAHANTHALSYIHTSFNISAAPPLSLSTIDIIDARHDQAGV
jgi:hypothetical protein